MHFDFRVLTPSRASGYTQPLISAEKGTVWDKIYQNNMNEDSYVGASEGTKIVLESNDHLAIWGAISTIYFNSGHPCEVRVAWESPGVFFQSFAFPKNSSLWPFFERAYKKLRENGAWERLNAKWKHKIPTNCNVGNLESFSLKKVISPIVLLIVSIFVLSSLTLLFELVYDRSRHKVQSSKLINVRPRP